MNAGDGEIGFLINASWTKNFYNENYIESESPFDTTIDGSTVVIPYRAQYGIEEGHVTRPSINAVLQWKPSDNLDFILEGGYLGSRAKRPVERHYVQDIPFMPAGSSSDEIGRASGRDRVCLYVEN